MNMEETDNVKEVREEKDALNICAENKEKVPQQKEDVVENKKEILTAEEFIELSCMCDN
jgi:hypothetical protein